MKTYKGTCPICNGSGKFEYPQRNGYVEIKKQMIKTLREAGYGIRQIQRALNYKSPRSIQVIIDKNYK